MQPIRLLATFAVVLIPSLTGLSRALADQPEFDEVHSPLLRAGEVTPKSDLGTWDDAFVCRDQDFVVLRRGEEIFSLVMNAAGEPKKLLTAPAADHTQITAAIAVEERLWLFLYSRDTTPVALDIYSGDVVKFEIPGLAIPGKQTPGIQSPVLVPHARAAILSVSGGDQATWPRDGNHPIYFWMDLKSGKLARFKTGWDLGYFSADQQVAVFHRLQERPDERRPLQAVELRGGALVEKTPDWIKELCIPFDWSHPNGVHPLYAKRPETGDQELFRGLSHLGRVLPLDIDLEGKVYLAQAKANATHAGFRLRGQGGSHGEPSPYWIAPFKEPEKRQRVAEIVVNFALLKGGTGVFVTANEGYNEPLSGPFFHGREREKWKVLDRIERLPELDPEFAGKDFIEDRLITQLVESFGKEEQDPLVLCVCTHQRGDRRAAAPLGGKLLKSAIWRRTVALTSSGERSGVPILEAGSVPDILWLHHAGKLVYGNYTWHTVGDKRERQVQLVETNLKLPRDEK